MSCEIDCITNVEFFERALEETTNAVSKGSLYQSIYSPDFHISPLKSKNFIPLKVGGNVEVKIEATWGGKEKSEISVGASGEIYDDRGNYAKGEAKQTSEGEGKVSISAGHKEETNR